MALLGSLLIAVAVLSLRLMIQSRMMVNTDENKSNRLAKRIEKLNLVMIIPVGFIMIIAGLVWWNSLKDSFLPVGVTLIVASILMLAQSQSLILRGDKAIKVGRKLAVWAWVCFGAVIIGLAFLIFIIIRTLI